MRFILSILDRISNDFLIQKRIYYVLKRMIVTGSIKIEYGQ